METAVRSVIDGNLSIRGASQLHDLPFSTLHRKVKNRKAIAAGLHPRVGDKIGHPTILSPEMEEALVEERILYLDERGLGLTSIHVRRAAFNLAEVTKLKYLWNTDKKVA